MSIFSKAFYLAATSAIVVGASYTFLPKAYASVAVHTPLLPITDHIRQSAPGVMLKRQLTRLHGSANELRHGREKLNTNRKNIEKKVELYVAHQKRAKVLLDEAQSLMREEPNLESYYFHGRRYTARDFEMQIDSIAKQDVALSESIESLNKARKSVERIWQEVAAKESSLVADKSRINTALLIAKTNAMLKDYEVDINFNSYEKMDERVRFNLRTIDELLQTGIESSLLPALSDSSIDRLLDLSVE